MTEIQNMDWSILGWIQANMKCEVLDFLMPKITALGNAGIFWIALALVLLAIKKTRKTGLLMVIGLLAGALICNLTIKPLVARSRPCWLDPSVAMLIPVPKDFSFPSGHTVASTISAVIVSKRCKYGWPSIILAVLIGFSRMYLYAHFPSDVLVGALLGLAIGFTVLAVNRKLEERKRTQ